MSIIGMIENGRACLDIARQVQAVENAMSNAKKTLVQDHIDHCLEQGVRDGSKNTDETVREFKAVTKYL